ALGSTAGLLLELTLRGGQWFFARLELALGNRPGPLVLLRPKRSSRVHQEQLRLTVPQTKHQETCALLRHLLPPWELLLPHRIPVAAQLSRQHPLHALRLRVR